MTGRRAWTPALALGLVLMAMLGAAADPRVFELAIKGGRLPENQRLLRIGQGDEVTLRWTTDRALALHLHGYDIETKVAPPAPAEMRFKASAAGRFAIEIHDAGGKHATIGYLEVHPR